MKAFKNRLEEMVHYDKLGDFLLKASDVMDTDIPGNNQLTVHPLIDLGTSAESALRLSLQAEKETLEEYEDSDDEPKKCKSVTVII